jgi:4-amino-4-deoxy-L-arabinose transferase-like glycosyltransferase
MERPSSQSLLVPALAAFAVALCCFSFKLGSVPLAGTEGHRVMPGHEMAQTGEWLVPRLFGEPYLRKPPLYCWVVAAGEKFTGRANEWIWRMPSAKASALLAGFVAFMAGRWFGLRVAWLSGLSYLALFALWSQSRSADIDSLLHLAAVVCGLSFIEINFGPSQKKAGWAVAAALSLGAALLLKAHAGLVVVLAALIGPAIANRDWRWLRRGWTWFVFAIGSALFAAWLIAALNYMRVQGIPLGLEATANDAADSMFVMSWRELAQAVSVPLLLLLYALPVSLSLVFVRKRDLAGSLTDEQRRLVRALEGTFYAALVILVLAGVTNLRYCYQALPLLAPLSGLVLAGWSDARPRRVRMIGAVLVVVVALAMVFAVVKNRERSRRSAFAAAQVLEKEVGAGAPVYAAKMIRTHPELFYYSHVTVMPSVRYGFDLDPGFTPPPNAWLVLHASEWASYSTGMPDRVKWVADLPTHVPGTVLARYSAAPEGLR